MGSRLRRDVSDRGSRVFHLLKQRGQISVEVTGKQRNKGIGLKMSATYSFYHKKTWKDDKRTNETKKIKQRLIDVKILSCQCL